MGAAAVYLAARELSWRELAAAFAGIRPGWIAAALAAAFAGQFVKALRWRIMLASEPDPPGLRTAWVYHLSGQLGNILIPGPAGDVGRIVVLGGRGQGRMFTLGTVALEKVLDLLAYGFVLVFVLAGAPLPDWAADSALTLLGLAVLIGLVFWAGVRYRARLGAFVAAVAARLPRAWGLRVEGGLKAAASGLQAVRGRPQVIRLLLTTVGLWTASLLVNHLMALAFGLDLPPIAPALLLVILQAGVSTNIVPGTIGLFEFLCVQTLALYDVPRQVAFSLGLVLHAVVLAPLVTAAVVGFLGGFWRK